MKLLITVALLALALGVTACGFGPDKSREDAVDVTNVCPEGAQRVAEPSCVDKTAPSVITFNNHYPNVETKCDGFGHRLFVTTHDSATGRNVLIMPDPSCPGYRRDEPAVTVGG